MIEIALLNKVSIYAQKILYKKKLYISIQLVRIILLALNLFWSKCKHKSYNA